MLGGLSSRMGRGSCRWINTVYSFHCSSGPQTIIHTYACGVCELILKCRSRISRWNQCVSQMLFMKRQKAPLTSPQEEARLGHDDTESSSCQIRKVGAPLVCLTSYIVIEEREVQFQRRESKCQSKKYNILHLVIFASRGTSSIPCRRPPTPPRVSLSQYCVLCWFALLLKWNKVPKRWTALLCTSLGSDGKV